MTGKSDFEARLKKMGHGQTSIPAQQPVIAPVKPANNSLTLALLAALAGVVVVGSVMAYFATKPKYRPMETVTSAFLADETPPKGPAAFGPFETPVRDHEYLQSCLPFFPPAPEGWVRVTTWDATYPQVMTRLSDLWEAREKSLSSATGYRELRTFLDRYSGPLAKTKNIKLQDTISSAMYFDIENDGYIQITLMSRPWNKSSNCREEFLYQWDQQDAANPPRDPVLNQFSYSSMTRNVSGLSTAQRDHSFRRMRIFDEVSPGLSLVVNAVHKARTPFEILNDDIIAERVALLQHDS